MKRGAIRLAAFLLTLCIAVALMPSISNTEAEAAAVTLNYHSKTVWLAETPGTHSGTVFSGGKLTLASGGTSGTFTTGNIYIGSFDTMIASWNAQTNGGKISVAVRFEMSGGSWSGWYSWGIWSSTRGVSGSSDLYGTHANMEIDTLSVISGYTTTGNINIRVTLTKYNGGTPVVSNVSVTTPTLPKQSAVLSYPSSYVNNVPMRSQVASENGSIGNIICSPTTTAMALEHMGTYVSSLTAAYDMYDNNWGAYGNWSFAAAYAGEKGYTAFVDYYDVSMMKYALSQGVVLGCSTMLTSSGHLVLVTGYDEEKDQFIVNDPNVSASNVVVTRYSTSYFTSKWYKVGTLGVVYVFQKSKDIQSFNGISPADYAANSMVKLKNVATGKYMTNDADNNVSVKASNDSAEQIWKVVSIGNSRYSFINAATGRYLDVSNGGNTSGTNVQTYTSNSSNAQQFFLYKSGNYYNIKPSYAPTLFLNVSGENVQLGAASATNANEQFVIENVSVSLPTDRDYIKLTAINASQYTSSAQIWTTGTFKAVYWGVLVLQPGSEGYTVIAKYESGESKSVDASISNLVLAIHQDQTEALASFSTVNVGDTVGLVGVYPGLGAMATDGYIALPIGFKLSEGSAYELDDEYVTMGASDSAAALNEQFACDVTIVNASGVEISAATAVGTGCVVQQKNSNGAVINSVEVVVVGDITGDSVVSTIDIISLRKLLKGNIVLQGAYNKASDLDSDGTTSTMDYVLITLAVKG